MLHGPAAGAINSGPPRPTGRASGLRASNQTGATRVIELVRDKAELVASALPEYLACIVALRKDRLAGALSAASERRGSSAGRIGLRSGLHFEVGNSRDLAKKLELAITPSVRETLRCGALAARARAVRALDCVRLYEELVSMQPRKTAEARKRERRPASVEVSV